MSVWITRKDDVIRNVTIYSVTPEVIVTSFNIMRVDL